MSEHLCHADGTLTVAERIDLGGGWSFGWRIPGAES